MKEETRIQFDGEVDERGHIHPFMARVIRTRLARWRGKHVTVTITRYVRAKTQPQLGYYFDVVVPYYAEHVGEDDEKQMHQDLKGAFLARKRRVNRFTGEEEEYIPSLADATSEEMSGYLDRCIREAARMGLDIPPANSFREYRQ